MEFILYMKHPHGCFVGLHQSGRYVPTDGVNYKISPTIGRLICLEVTRDELTSSPSNDMLTFWALCLEVNKLKNLEKELGYPPKTMSREDLELLRRGVPIYVGPESVDLDGREHFHQWIAWPTGPVYPAGHGRVVLFCTQTGLDTCKACEENANEIDLENIRHRALKGEDVADDLIKIEPRIVTKSRKKAVR